MFSVSKRFCGIIALTVLSTFLIAGCGGEKNVDSPQAQEAAPNKNNEASKVSVGGQEQDKPGTYKPLTKGAVAIKDTSSVSEGFTAADQLRALVAVGELRENPQPLNEAVIKCINTPDAEVCDVLMPLVESVVVQHATERPRHHISHVLSTIKVTLSAPADELVVINTAAGAPRTISDREKECVILLPNDSRALSEKQKTCSEKLAKLKTGGPQVHSLPDNASKEVVFAASLYIASSTQEQPGNLYEAIKKCKADAKGKDCSDLMPLAKDSVRQLTSDVPLHDLDLMLERLTYLVTTDDPLYVTVVEVVE